MSTRSVHEKNWVFASSSLTRTLGRFGWVLVTEFHGHFVDTAFPIGVFFAGYTGRPLEEIVAAVTLGFGFGVKSNRVVFAPRLAFLL